MKYDLQTSIDLYKSVGKRNADFLFNWLYKTYDYFYLPSIDLKFKKDLTLIKTKLAIIDVLIDDLADNVDVRDLDLLEKATKIPFEHNLNLSEDYLNVINTLWKDCINSISNYPRFEEFVPLFYFDLHQVMNSMRYSFLSNLGYTGSEFENSLHSAHGVMVLLHSDLDLMCSPNIKKEEIKTLRPLIYFAQEICHLGNAINTYKREIEEKDFSSPLIILGLKNKLITNNEVYFNPQLVKEKLEPLEINLVKKADYYFSKIEEHSKNLNDFDVAGFSSKLRKVFQTLSKRYPYWES